MVVLRVRRVLRVDTVDCRRVRAARCRVATGDAGAFAAAAVAETVGSTYSGRAGGTPMVLRRELAG